jgi:hypothetical protein
MDLIGKRFRLTTNLLAIDTTGGQYKATSIRKGSVVTVVDGPQNSVYLAHVNWQGEKLVVFVDDLREHSEPISDSGP